jgi:hypothetical protein
VTLPPGTRTRAEQAWEHLRSRLPPDPDELANALFGMPVLLRADVVDWLVADKGVAADQLGEAMVGLTREIQRALDANPKAYRRGLGPVEALWADIDAGTRSVDQAMHAAVTLQITETLTAPYIQALLASLIDDAMRPVTWRQSRTAGRIVLAAVEACDRRAEPAMRRARCLGTMLWAHALLIAVPDRELLDEAAACGRDFLQDAEASGEPSKVGEAQTQLAGLWGDPYMAGRTTAGYALQHQAWRIRGEQELSGRDGRPGASWLMPEANEALAEALNHWRAAKQILPDRPDILAGLAETCVWSAHLGKHELPAEGAAAVEHGLEVTGDDPDSLPLMSRFRMLAKVFGVSVPHSARIDMSSDDLVQRYGTRAGNLVFHEILAVRSDDPVTALSLLEQHKELLLDWEQISDDSYRLLAQIAAGVLNRVYGSSLAEDAPDPTQDYGERVTSIVEQLGNDRGTTHFAAVLLRLAIYSSLSNAESIGLQLLKIAREQAPLFARRHEWIFRTVEAELFLGSGVNAYNEQDFATALRRYVRALDSWVRLGREEPVSDILGRLADIAGGADEPAAIELVSALVGAAPLLVTRIGGAVEGQLQQVLATVLGALIERDALNSEITWALLQFAKGLRTAMLLSRTSQPRLLDDPEAKGVIDRLRARADLAGNATELTSLRQVFERRRRRVTLTGLASPDLLDLEQARRAFDHRTVLVSTATVADSNGLPARIAYVVWDDDQAVVSTGPMTDPEAPVPWVPGQLFEVLAGLRRDGRDHLCLVPDAGLQTASWHTLGDDTWCLADEWIVTMLPHPHLLWATRGGHTVARAPRLPVLAVGLDHAGVTDGRPVLPDAVEEVRTISAQRGGRSLINSEATEAAFRALAPDAAYIHVDFDPETPAFHSLALHPDGADDGLLTAWEVTELRLSATRLVTLSACETAKMSVEPGDNLDGLPIAFLAAGARAIVGTQSEIETRVSRFFFEHFYASLDGATDLRDPFRSAQVATRTEFPAPGDWSAFYFLGDWR